MLNDVMGSKINKANIGLFIGFHKPLAQVINGWKTLVIVSLRKI